METQNIRQRSRDVPIAAAKISDNRDRPRRDRRIAMAKRGLRSLSVAVAIPLSLSLLSIYFSSASSHRYSAVSKPFWFPPLWLIHGACLISSFLMGLSAWLVWAEGGFHKSRTALSLYLAQLGLSLAWDFVVLRMGASWAGLVLCLAMFGSLVGCSNVFRKMNPIAGDIIKPCLAWAAFLAVVNLELVFL